MAITPDPTTGEYSNVAFALDTHAAVAGEPSLLDNVSDFVTKAVPLTGLSVVNSFVNTGVELTNMFGYDNDKATVEDEVGDGDLNDYYQQHQQGIEAAGLAVGSLIPGLAGIKVLKLAQAGKMGSTMAAATNIFAGPKQAIIDGAMENILNPSTSLVSSITADKFKAVALGFGEQALQSLAYEAATTATMKANPLLDNQGLSETVDGMLYGALGGGAIGGVLDGVGSLWAFRKAALAAGEVIKPSQLVGRLSDQAQQVLAGDRALEIVNAVDKLPEKPASVLGKVTQNKNYESSLMDAKLALQPISPDPLVASDFIDSLMTAKKAGQSKEDIYSQLTRLAKITRITDDTTVPAGDTFYINRFNKSDNADFSQLFTKTPEAGAKFAEAYQLKAGAGEVKVARFGDPLDPNSVFGDATKGVPLYSSSDEAFQAGHDVFLNKNLQAIVNPASPNLQKIARPGESRPLTKAEEDVYRSTGQLPAGSKQLLGEQIKFGEEFQTGPGASNTNAPLIYNLKTGGSSTSAMPVVGDFGKVEVTPRGLSYGDQLSPQTLSTDFGKDTSAIDANARFTWAGLRGIQKGDTISGNDLPMLEQLYRQSGVDNTIPFQQFITDNKLTFTGDIAAPSSRVDLQNYIQQQKSQLVSQLLETDPKMSAEELSLRTNVSQDYIAGGLKSTKPTDFMVDPKTYTTTNHVKLWYDIGNIYQDDGMILKGMIDNQYRMKLIKDTVQTNLADFVGKFSDNKDFARFIVDGSSSEATPIGVEGKGFLSSAQSAYNSLGQKAERVGRELASYLTTRGAAISKELSPSVNALRSDYAVSGAEASIFAAVRQRTQQAFKFLPDDLQAQHFPQLMAGEKVAVLRDSLQVDSKASSTSGMTWDKSYAPENFLDGAGLLGKSADAKAGNYTYYVLSKNVADFESATQALNSDRILARNNLRTANGLRPLSADPDTLYTPPLDTTQYKHFALVKFHEGMGGVDDSVGMVVAQDAAQLQAKIASIDPDTFSVWTKDMIAKNHQVLGDYEYSRNFADNRVNAELSRRGILSDVYPDTRVDTLIQRHVDWHTRAESQLARDHVESANGQLFAELKAMGEQYTATDTSIFGSKNFLQSSYDPYKSYINTALNLQPKESYRAWYAANEKVEAFFDTAFSVARTGFEAAFKKKIGFDDAVTAAKKFGLGDVYGEGVNALQNFTNLTNKLPPQRYLAQFLSQASAAMNYTVIRLDAWQQLVHALSTPILLNAELASANAAVKDLMTTELPQLAGQAGAAVSNAVTRVPATSKLFFNAISNLFNDEARGQWQPVYERINALRNPESELLHRQMREELTLPFGKSFSQEGLAAQGARAVQYASKLSNWTEFVTSFITADAGRQLFEAKGYTGRALEDNITSFVNRVKGNVVASQRPVAFQGPIGQAVGLFQTYQFNMMQNLFRYVGNREGKPLAIAAGMQASLFGMSSLPGFHMMNNHIIGNAYGNTDHADVYSSVPNYFGKKLGDYLLYGVASNVLNASIYTRGDMNPRNITLLPVNPLNYPAIAGGVRLYQALSGVAEKIAQGGDTQASILLGLEHNGLSRPLAGIAQLMQGYSTTSEGKLQSAAWPSPSFNPLGDNTTGLNEVFNAGVFSRLLGARPLDEAVAMDEMYRKNLYTAKDNARMQTLGESVKTTLYNNKEPSQDQLDKFSTEYAASGGRIENFSRHMIQWTTDANASVANKVYSKLSSPQSKQQMMIMGGVPLPDFRNTGSTQAAAPTAPVE